MGQAIAGYEGSLLVTSPPSVALTNDVLTDSGDHTTYTEATAAHRYWDRSTIPVVQTSPDGTTWTTQSATLYKVQYIGGKIIWNTAQASGTQTRISSGVSYFPYALLANITQWSFDGEMSFEDSTSMSGAIGGGSGSPFKTFVPMLLTGLMSVTKFWVPETSEGYVADIVQGTYLLFSGVAGTGNRYEGYGWVKKMGIKTDVSKLTESPLDIQFDGSFYAT